MKKYIIMSLADFFLSNTVMTVSAATVREDCGCGLGAVAIGEKEGFWWKMLGTLLNGTCGNQTFGMTSGTLDCDKKTALFAKLDTYVSDNMDSLAIDIAQGQGESLDALAEIAQISSDKKAEFYASLQNNFTTIFPNEDVTHLAVAAKIAEIARTI